MEELIMILLECRSNDLHILDDTEYNLEEIVNELINNGVKPTLNAITNRIFEKAQDELYDAVNKAIKDKTTLQQHVSKKEARHLQDEIDELESLNPMQDMKWSCNCRDTSCWFANNQTIYRIYFPTTIKMIERNMGFEFS